MCPIRLASALAGVSSVALAFGCGSAPTVDGGSTATGAGGDAGGSAGGCPAGEQPVGDRCVAAGVPAHGCGVGFEPDGEHGCTAVLPDEPCGSGQMALPGETRCREVAPCGAGRWGAIPVEADTQYVDAAYAGGASDGSADSPWTSVQAAVTAAAPGAAVAIAEGTYLERVDVFQPVRIWGRCPDRVLITGNEDGAPGMVLHVGADDSEVRDLSLTAALAVTGAGGVVVDRLWVHDTTAYGVVAIDVAGPVQVAVRRSLIERNPGAGVFAAGADLIFEDSVVRDSTPDGDRETGRGVQIEDGFRGPCQASIARCVVERNASVGIGVATATVDIEDTLLRDVTPFPATQKIGRGLDVAGPVGRSHATVRRSVIERAHEVGLLVLGSTAVVEATVIRDVAPTADDMHGGYGLLAQYNVENGERSEVTLRSSLIDEAHAAGLVVLASDAVVESSRVRATRPLPDGTLGSGVVAQPDLTTPTVERSTRSTLGMRWSVIEDNRLAGLTVVGSDAIVESTAIVQTAAQQSDDAFGDGVVVVAGAAVASVEVSGCLVSGSARAGLACFGSSARVGDSIFECNGIDLDSELLNGPLGIQTSSFLDVGGNTCGCSGEEPCVVQSANLEPPSAVEP